MKKLSETQRSRIMRQYFDLVSQTAEFRHRVCWAGARDLFGERGYDPMGIIQVTCDQGDDIHGDFVLGDGTAVSCDLKEDPRTRQAVSFQSWQVIPWRASDEDEFALAAEICGDERLKQAFDLAVRAFFDFHWAACDEPLPMRSLT